MPSVEQLIRKYARKHGIDPRAAIAVAMGEGGLRRGGVGDQGTSFGPFQLHVGGALPRGRGASWANSPAGIEYAIRQMAKHARGKQGQAAINAIIRQFERPADPDTSVRNAIARYGGIHGGGGGMVRAPRRNRVNRGGGAGNPLRQAGLAALNQIASGEFDAGAIFTSLAAARKEAKKWGGTLSRPKARNGKLPQAANPVINKILQAANAQIGKPYVWGGESPQSGFDCSGLLDWAFRQAGIDLPGRLTSQSALHMGRSVKGKKLQPGDWLITNGGKHIVMYVGGNKVIAAPHTGSVVQYQPISRFRGDIVDIRRIL